MSQKKKILLVDDDQTILVSLGFVLELEGFCVDLAENGVEAVEKNNAHFYNLAILDWHLPDVKGTTLLIQLKESNPRMSTIMLTGTPLKEVEILAIKNGVDTFILKPIDTDSLLNKINELLKKQEELTVPSQEEVTIYVEPKTIT
jgi:DNA-binding response OmpR family regulator